MNKYKQLSKKTGKAAVVALMVVGLTGAVYAGVSYYAASVAEKKTEADRKFSDDDGKLKSYRSQMDKSGEAEKRFAAIQETRNSSDFEANMAKLKNWFLSAKQQYHLNEPSLASALEVATDKQDLKNLPYDVTLRPGLKLEFKAVSDLHMFSLLDEMRRSAPGLVRVEAIEVKRLHELGDGEMGQLRSGISPLGIEAKITFSWIGIVPKEQKDPKAAAAPSAAP